MLLPKLSCSSQKPCSSTSRCLWFLKARFTNRGYNRTCSALRHKLMHQRRSRPTSLQALKSSRPGHRHVGTWSLDGRQLLDLCASASSFPRQGCLPRAAPRDPQTWAPQLRALHPITEAHLGPWQETSLLPQLQTKALNYCKAGKRASRQQGEQPSDSIRLRDSGLRLRLLRLSRTEPPAHPWPRRFPASRAVLHAQTPNAAKPQKRRLNCCRAAT